MLWQSHLFFIEGRNMKFPLKINKILGSVWTQGLTKAPPLELLCQPILCWLFWDTVSFSALAVLDHNPPTFAFPCSCDDKSVALNPAIGWDGVLQTFFFFNYSYVHTRLGSFLPTALLQTFYQVWPWTRILPVSTWQVCRIIDLSYCSCPKINILVILIIFK
jgi:hypothetical protein